MSSLLEKLDPPKKGVRRHRVVIDPSELPDALVDVYAEACKPFHHTPESRKRISKGKLEGFRVKRMVWVNQREKKARKGVWRVDGGTGDKILALAGEWTTRHEIRVALGVYRGLVSRWLDRLWRRGQLLKRKNPAWSGKPGWGAGVARCMFQYKRASGVGSDKPQGEDDGRRESVQDP